MGDEAGAMADAGWRDRQKIPAGEAAAAPAPATEDRSPLSVEGGSPSVSSAPAGMTAAEALDVLREVADAWTEPVADPPSLEKPREAIGVLAAELERLRYLEGRLHDFAQVAETDRARAFEAERDLAVARQANEDAEYFWNEVANLIEYEWRLKHHDPMFVLNTIAQAVDSRRAALGGEEPEAAICVCGNILGSPSCCNFEGGEEPARPEGER